MLGFEEVQGSHFFPFLSITIHYGLSVLLAYLLSEVKWKIERDK